MINKDVDAAVGMSRLWDARKAGREVARQAIKDLKQPPSFFVLFSTIHYKDHGGFEQLLAGVWEVLPKGTPLVGGTVAGFMNNFGCYTHGCTALAVCCEQMDVAVGVGRNTKRNPKRAARQCARMIQSGLQHSKYDNKFLLNLVSGPETMKIPGQGYKKVVDSGFMSRFVSFAFGMSQFLLQKGPGREDEIFEELVKEMPESKILLGTTMDDYKWIDNYQFVNDKILTNSSLIVGLSTNYMFDVYTTHGMKETDIKFDITKLSRNGHIIHKINNKPALQELQKLLNWPDGFINEKTMAHTILYYPISLKRHGRQVPAVMPTFLKDSILTPCIVDKGEISILTVSGKDLIKAIGFNLSHFKDIEPEFGLFSSCMTILQTLGNNISIVQKEISNSFNGKPFVMFFCAGEGTYSLENNIIYANMSFNSAIFSS